MNDLIVVTGAAGLIGRNVVAELNRRGNDNLILCDLLGKDEKWKNLRGLSFEDILSPNEFLQKLEQGAFKETKAIVHLGACSSTTEKDADYLLENNYRYTRRLCEFSLANRIRFIYASSAATYGDGSRGYLDDDAVTRTLPPPQHVWLFKTHVRPLGPPDRRPQADCRTEILQCFWAL